MSMKQVKLSDLPEEITKVLKEEITTAHARTIQLSTNDNDSLCAISVPMFKEDKYVCLVFGRKEIQPPETSVTIGVGAYELVSKHELGIDLEFIPQLVGNVLFLDKDARIPYANSDNGWVVAEQEAPATVSIVRPVPNGPKRRQQLYNKLTVKCSQPIEQIMALASILGLTLVYEEENKLVFNKVDQFPVPFGMQPSSMMSTQFMHPGQPTPNRNKLEYPKPSENFLGAGIFQIPSASLVIELVEPTND